MVIRVASKNPRSYGRLLATACVAGVIGIACGESPPSNENDGNGSGGTNGGTGTGLGGGAGTSAGTSSSGTGGMPSGGANTGGSETTGGTSGTTGGTTGGASGASGAGGASGASGGGGTSAGNGGTGGSATGGNGGAAGANGGGAGFEPGGVRFVGRVDASNAAAVRFAWSGTGVVATVEGTRISARLQTEGTSTVFFQPVVDGTKGTRFQVMSGAAQTVVVGQNLAAGAHRIELYRESEGNYGTSVFLGFAEGTVVGAPAATRLIEIVGDSISAGYGNLGNDVHPPYDVSCGFSLDTESAYAAYGWVLARSLNADASIIARSGWGIYRDNGGSRTNVLPSIYGNTLGSQSNPAWDFAKKPDAVIVNLGTNDTAGEMGDPGTPYEDAYIAFLRTVRGHYPNAWIFITLGPMTSDPLLTTMRGHLDNVVTRLGDAKVTHVQMPVQNTSMTGCDYHPNAAEDALMANTLKPALQQKLGW